MSQTSGPAPILYIQRHRPAPSFDRMVSGGALDGALNISRTQVRRAQRKHSKQCYHYARSHLLALVRPTPINALRADALEDFRRSLYAPEMRVPVVHAELIASSIQPAVGPLGASCNWCGTWTPIPDTAVDVSIQNTILDPASCQQSGDIAHLPSRPDCDEESDISSIAVDTPISASGGIGGAYENHHGLINVPGTFFTYPDLYAAVTTCWIGCDAVQPLLAKAVTLHGGQTIRLPAQPPGKSGAWTPLLELNSPLITGRPPLPELPSDQPSRPESPCELFVNNHVDVHRPSLAEQFKQLADRSRLLQNQLCLIRSQHFSKYLRCKPGKPEWEAATFAATYGSGDAANDFVVPQLFNPSSAAVEPIEPPVPASHSTAGNDCKQQ